MKKINHMYELFCGLLLFAWLIPVRSYVMDARLITGFVCNLVSLVILCVVKNKNVATVSAVLLSVGMSIYSYHYIFYALIPILLISAYEISTAEAEKQKQQSGGLSTVFITAAMVMIAVQAVYTLGVYDKMANQFSESVLLLYLTIIPIPLLFAVFYRAVSKSDKKSNKENVSELKLILLLSVTGMLTSMAFYFASSGIANRSIRIDFSGWYVFLLIICRKSLIADKFFEKLRTRIKILVE